MSLEEEEETTAKGSLKRTIDEANDETESKIRICKHICEKKMRRCKFNAIKNCDYCVEHLAFNNQTENAEKRIVCPLDPKHSVYEKNFAKHMKKCNAIVKTLGEFDIKDINTKEKNDDSQLTTSGLENSYKELSREELLKYVHMAVEFDRRFKLYDLEFNKLSDEYIENELVDRNNSHQKHLKQISSIVSHVDAALLQQINDDEDCCLVELGAGRGKLSYWLAAANKKKEKKKNVNILLVERGAQRYKFDTQLRADAQKTNAQFERIRIDLKDLYLNKVPLIVKSSKYILYGKHLCGVATDYALRCLKYSLTDMAADTSNSFKFGGLVLAVCCHHQCEWNAFCGQKFLKDKLNIDAKMFYILRSMTSWYTCGETVEHPKEDLVPGFNRPKLGRICKNLFDYARLQYLNDNLQLPPKFQLETKLFYYIEPDVTLENSLIFINYSQKN